MRGGSDATGRLSIAPRDSDSDVPVSLEQGSNHYTLSSLSRTTVPRATLSSPGLFFLSNLDPREATHREPACNRSLGCSASRRAAAMHRIYNRAVCDGLLIAWALARVWRWREILD